MTEQPNEPRSKDAEDLWMNLTEQEQQWAIEAVWAVDPNIAALESRLTAAETERDNCKENYALLMMAAEAAEAALGEARALLTSIIQLDRMRERHLPKGEVENGCLWCQWLRTADAALSRPATETEG